MLLSDKISKLRGINNMTEDLTIQDKLKFLVVDDHELILNGTVVPLQQKYPEAEIKTAQTSEEALKLVEEFKPNLIIIDLSIPEKIGLEDEIEVGLNLLKILMKKNINLHLVVVSSFPETLIQIKHIIDNYEGGFAVVHKASPIRNLLDKVHLALFGATHTKDIPQLQTGEIKPEWLEFLNLRYKEGLELKEIAERMKKSLRAVNGYKNKIKDFLDISDEEGKSLDLQTEMAARKAGLID